MFDITLITGYATALISDA